MRLVPEETPRRRTIALYAAYTLLGIAAANAVVAIVILVQVLT